MRPSSSFFLRFAVILAKYAISTSSEKFGSKPTQIIQQISLGGFIDQEKKIFFAQFCTFQNPTDPQ